MFLWRPASSPACAWLNQIERAHRRTVVQMGARREASRLYRGARVRMRMRAGKPVLRPAAECRPT